MSSKLIIKIIPKENDGILEIGKLKQKWHKATLHLQPLEEMNNNQNILNKLYIIFYNFHQGSQKVGSKINTKLRLNFDANCCRSLLLPSLYKKSSLKS